MTVPLLQRFSVIAMLAAFAGPVTFAKTNVPQITNFGHDVRVGEDQKVDEVTCFGCTVYVRGQVAGDITTFVGNIVVEGNGQVAGEVTTFLGDLRLDNGTKVAGDVTVFGGNIRRPPTAMIAGDITVFRARTWAYLVLLSPFLVFAGIIALIVWLVQRNRRASSAMARAA